MGERKGNVTIFAPFDLNYLTAIFIAFSSLQFKVALTIFQIFQANEIPVYYPLECFFSLYYIQVATNLDR